MAKCECSDGSRSVQTPDLEEVRPLRKRRRPTNPPTAATKSLKCHTLTHLSTSYPHIPPHPRYQSPPLFA